MSLAAERRSVVVGGARVAYEVAGDGPAVVLVHGLGGSGRWWRRNVPALADQFRVYVVDLVGFGGSRGGGPFALAAAEAVLVAWLDRLAIARAALVGHSLGGRVATGIAAEAPGRVSHLVLACPAIFPARRPLAASAVDLARSWRHTRPDFLPVMAAETLRASPRAYFRAARELVSADAEALLGRVAAPTLLIWGENDTVVPPTVGRRVAALVPAAESVVIRGTGHSPMWDRADEFNRLLIGFLQKGDDPVVNP